jgi:hypothetical protein
MFENQFARTADTIEGHMTIKERLSEARKQQLKASIDVLKTSIQNLQDSKDRVLSNLDEVDRNHGNDKEYEKDFDLAIADVTGELKAFEYKLQIIDSNEVSIPGNAINKAVNDDTHTNFEQHAA